MSSTRFVLRELPGVAELEARLQRIEDHPNPEWAPEADGLEKAVDALSKRLFGITYDDTLYEDDEELSDEENLRAFDAWRLHFQFLYLDDEDERVEKAVDLIWDAMGWDCTGGDGRYLLAYGQVARQLVCATKGLCGHLPGTPRSDAEIVADAEEWGEKLAREAAKRRPGGGR
jgi:hypothetical protein